MWGGHTLKPLEHSSTAVVQSGCDDDVDGARVIWWSWTEAGDVRW